MITASRIRATGATSMELDGTLRHGVGQSENTAPPSVVGSHGPNSPPKRKALILGATEASHTNRPIALAAINLLPTGSFQILQSRLTLSSHKMDFLSDGDNYYRSSITTGLQKIAGVASMFWLLPRCVLLLRLENHFVRQPVL